MHPLSWFILSSVIFYSAIQRPPGYERRVLSILHILSILFPLYLRHKPESTQHYHMCIHFVVYSTVHTASVLLVDRQFFQPKALSFTERLKAVYRIWSNIRRLSLAHSRVEGKSRSRFAAIRVFRLGALWLTHLFTTELTSTAFRRLSITMLHFSPSNRGLLPPLSQSDVCLRVMMTVHWIWSSYAILIGSHDFFAIFFVCIFRWDRPEEWPDLFGPLAETYSLRRFWGVFWHRLHVEPFEKFMPSSLVQLPLQKPALRQRKWEVIMKPLRAFWMFSLSAIFHSIINWITIRRLNATEEFRFFLCNFAVCFVETMMEHLFKSQLRRRRSWNGKLFGYIWVFSVFFCIAPSWQYSHVYAAADNQGPV